MKIPLQYPTTGWWICGGWNSRCYVTGIWYRLCLYNRKQSGDLAMVLTGWIFLSRLREAYSVETIQAEAWWILKELQVASSTCPGVVGFQQASHLLGEFVQCRVLGLALRDADAAGLGWLSGIFISNKCLWGFGYRWFPECHLSSLFPFSISPPSLCQCCGAFQKESCFWRWRSRLISHDYLLGVGRFHKRTYCFSDCSNIS